VVLAGVARRRLAMDASVSQRQKNKLNSRKMRNDTVSSSKGNRYEE
jgi:hypothetical protein